MNPNPNPNRIIVPAHFDQEITILVDTSTGQTELRHKKPMNPVILAGILAEHLSGIMRQIISGQFQSAQKPGPMVVKE